MSSAFAIAKNELKLAWQRYRLRRCNFASGLGDSGWLLHGLVRSLKPEVCVEVGSAHGYSTCLISLALEENRKGHLWAVDPHEINSWSDDRAQDTFSSLQKNLRAIGQAGRRVEIIRKQTSQALADLPSDIDIAFIDGDHSYEGVRADWEILRPRMREFGVVIFHDTLWDRNARQPRFKKWRRDGMGVPQLLEELRLQGYPAVTIDQDWGSTLVQATRGGQSFQPTAFA